MVIQTDHLPAPGETILGGTFFMAAGGKGANQAVAAARLGGAHTFIEKLKDGYDTFLTEPLRESYMGPREGSRNQYGRVFDTTKVREAAGMKLSTDQELSGGQMQRLAV